MTSREPAIKLNLHPCCKACAGENQLSAVLPQESGAPLPLPEVAPHLPSAAKPELLELLSTWLCLVFQKS